LPRKGWFNVKPKFTPGTYCFPANPKNLKILDLPNPRDWSPLDEDWNLRNWKDIF